jgi:hypothetical protein
VIKFSRFLAVLNFFASATGAAAVAYLVAVRSPRLWLIALNASLAIVNGALFFVNNAHATKQKKVGADEPV